MLGEDVVFESNRSEASPEKDLWRTPSSVLETIRKRWGPITCDAAGRCEDPVLIEGLSLLYTPTGRYARVAGKSNPWKKFAAEDALHEKPWRDEHGYPPRRVFLNPPYSMVKAFIKRAIRAVENDRVREVVLLTAARTDTRWFQPLFELAEEIVFMKGRVRFLPPGEGGDVLNPAPFPSVLTWLTRRGGPARCLGWERASREW